MTLCRALKIPLARPSTTTSGGARVITYSTAGYEVLDGGLGGADDIRGYAGGDTVSYASAGTGVIIDLNVQLTWDGMVNDTLSSIENAIGSSFSDHLWGSSGDNVLDGGSGGA